MKMTENRNILVFGEVLFDDFGAEGKVLGGAPFNVAWHLKGFGFEPLFVSRIGHDKGGEEVRRRMRNWGMSLAGLQTDSDYPTGLVAIDIIRDEPKFNILPDQAYDHIKISGKENFFENFPFKIIYHGTLALRNTTSYTSLKRIIQKENNKIFLDVNLREPWWQIDQLFEIISGVSWLKCNHEEFKLISEHADTGSDNTEKAAWSLCNKFKLDLILITKGSEGAMIVNNTGKVWRGQPETMNQISDTVGAGDGFSAVTLIGILLGWDLNTLLKRAIHFASQICGIRGATINDPEFYNEQSKNWI
jgi:fructokinase